MRFLRDAVVSELYSASDDGQPPPAGTTVRWFLLPRGSSAAADLDLAETFALTGTYIFLESPLPAGGEVAFAGAAWTLLGDSSFRNPRIAWFASGVPAGGELSGYVLSTPLSNPAVTGRTLVISYQNYALVVDNGTPFGLDPSAPAFTLTQTSQNNIGLMTEFGATTLAGTGSITIPLTGPDAGSFQFPLKLDQTDGVSDLTHLDVGLRNYYATPPSDSANGGAGTLVTSMRYPVFNESQTIALNASLAPWSIAESRSYFRFSAAALRSCYSTVTGFSLGLTPYTDASGPSATPAQLVFAARPGALPPSQEDLYTLVPKGDFALTVPSRGAATADEGIIAGSVPMIVPTSPNSRFMCGLSGVEYIGLNIGANALSFFTGNPAYANAFDPSTSAPTNLTDDATTAWAFLSVPSANDDAPPLTYYAQPDQAVLFQSSSGNTGAQPADAPFLPLVYFEVPSNSLPLKPSADTAIPLFPYSGISVHDEKKLSVYNTLETKVLSPLRRHTIAKLGSAPPAASVNPQFNPVPAPNATVTAVTPQGVLTTFTDTTLETIGEMVLAEMPDLSHFSLFNLPHGAPLRTAMATNQLFLIATNPDAIKPFLNPDPNKNSIEIEGWTFNVDTSIWNTTGQPGLEGTALIIKFAGGAIVDLVNNPSAWAKAESDGPNPVLPFNLNDQATSARILQLITDAETKAKKDPDFNAFVAAVTDPLWQGILILNAYTDLAQLPDECKGLAAGIEQSRFYAHHVGINIAKIVVSTPVSIEPSSMFALINYEAPNIPIVPSGAAYQFRVDSLKVLFKNSAIEAFSNKIELLIAALFGDTVDLDPAESVLELYGVLQRQTIAGKVYDTYLFQTAQNAPKVFPLATGSVFQEIQIASAQFVTQLDKSSDGLTHTYFALAGLLDFTELDGLDLFSFGGETAADVAGLRYNKLLVHMAFDPAVENSSVFTFDANGIAFDTGNSTARVNSLYQHFPITLTGLIQADSVSSPGGMGYLGVQSPLTQSALVYPWFGLTFDLDLGSLGALAAKAGFVASLIAAWSPSSGTPKLFVGLKMPGSDGGKGTISIEGVLNIGFRALVLGRNGDSNYYLLLNALALKFLSLTFPPGGQIDMALFGDPADAHNSSLGWYAAYTKDQAPKSGGGKDRAAQAALRQKTVSLLTQAKVK